MGVNMTEQEGVLVSTAKAIGKAAGKVAKLSGIEGEAPAKPKAKSSAEGRLPKKNKSRLPRKVKKQRKKVA
jgi:hypothetical protein